MSIFVSRAVLLGKASMTMAGEVQEAGKAFRSCELANVKVR